MSENTAGREAADLRVARELEKHARWRAGMATDSREQKVWLEIAEQWRQKVWLDTADQWQSPAGPIQPPDNDLVVDAA